MFTLCVVEAYATERANRFFRGIYQHDVFIPRDDATTLSDCLYDFVHAYLYQACVSSKQGKFDFFPLYPKVHAVHEVAHEQRRQCRLSPFTLNPAIHACSIDEDFIGRMAALSRCVSPRVIPQRTLNRYLVHIQICWARNLWKFWETVRWSGRWCVHAFNMGYLSWGIQGLFCDVYMGVYVAMIIHQDIAWHFDLWWLYALIWL